ncbi:MAG: HNH endonuclease [Alphaproteobacteria bacterium]|nr:HNH endonuclease [Alphaproteobacteria bacterium]
MPYSPPTHCPVYGHKPYTGKRCPACAASYVKPASNVFYHGRTWRRIADEYRASRSGVCESCGAPHATHVDHKVPRSRGGGDAPDNLQLLCVRCHGSKSATEGSRWGNTG